ncbi:hypothetical protein COCSADRAFT_39776 [Bipolaris sorokiniana ND90Pr]|uniref:Uncharacterized protein n=1 Tax=Cochliobolus sativus (strain ND90Pr / ATCC 201652) TaxID=665912 RepID=M2SW67_COCSN|nr:uncharacterized protein COCSADRAFT_39776 [Bipolaris sorokiniana ND90Pr]EMD61072.1 hypothetical protein COCSADRAFT_39776 [Bipolaris sorokiniana ND90Pr]
MLLPSMLAARALRPPSPSSLLPSGSVATNVKGAFPGPLLPLPDPAQRLPSLPLAIGCLPYCPLCQ